MKFKIGILTGGGDCPGLNAVIRAVVRRAILGFGWQVVGIQDGFAGLVENRVQPLGIDDVHGLLTRGGTILGATNRFDPFSWPSPDGPGHPPAIIATDRSAEVIDRARELFLDAVVVVGGDGTMTIARKLCEMGLPVVGVPKTIDNDLPATESTFGFHTAVQTVTECLDRLATTAESHDRVMICEVMGRDTGWIALSAAIAGGADVALIPELPYDVKRIGSTLRARKAAGRTFSVIVCAEGAVPIGGTASVVAESDGTRLRRLGGAGERLAEQLAHLTDHEVRVTVLGYIQRGGTPTAYDRLLGTRFGEAAVDLLASGSLGRMVALRANKVESVALSEVVGTRRVEPDGELVATARGIGIELGG